MAKKKKSGQRAEGIWAKSGKLYVVLSKYQIKDGKKVRTRKWISTNLPDTPDNVLAASNIRRNLLSQDIRESVDPNITVTDYVDLFLSKKCRTIRDTTYSSYLQRTAHIKSFFSDIKLRKINIADIEDFYDFLIVEKQLQARTLKDIKTLFNSIMEEAIKDNVIAYNPIKDATINKELMTANAKEKVDGSDFFLHDEAQRFLDYIMEDENYAMFYIALFYGLRREEILGIHWSSINFDAKEMTINHTVTKGTKINRQNATKTSSSTRIYPMTDELIELLIEIKEKETENRKTFGNTYIDNDYVFKNKNGKPYYPDYPSKAFRKIIRKHSDLPQNISLRGLRTSCVSILVHSNYNPKGAQLWVGHKEVSTTLKHYAKVKNQSEKLTTMDIMQSSLRPHKNRSRDTE